MKIPHHLIVASFVLLGFWNTKVFAQVECTSQSGEITLTTTSQGVANGVLKIEARLAPMRPAIASN